MSVFFCEQINMYFSIEKSSILLPRISISVYYASTNVMIGARGAKSYPIDKGC